MVEFALVLPMLLVLLLGIADFGRVFHASIVSEGATRDAAEVGALERLRNKPPTVPTERPAYYTALHQLIAQTACSEANLLPSPPEQAHPTNCPFLTAVRACVHDGLDTQCGTPIPGFDGAVPTECVEIAPATAPTWSNASGGEVGSHWVEVRLCYHFTTLLNLRLSLPFNAGLALGDVFLDRTRSFVLDCPPGAVTSC